MIVEFAGLTQSSAALIEKFRKDPSETKSDIIERVLGQLVSVPAAPEPAAVTYDLGQGATLFAGEKLYLFLFKNSRRTGKPEAIMEVRANGLYWNGKKVKPSKGSVLQPVMKEMQARLDHRNNKGELISLSAWRQWHVLRDNQFIPVEDLKDPALAYKRRSFTSDLTPLQEMNGSA